MGLSAPKNRNKLSQDPNNTAWSKSTDRFGHKILTQQGWAPGDTLGVKNASHSDHYTKASHSHIRVMLRDDNMGLGASKRGNAEQFGLDMFAGLLGRLNGKSETLLEKEQAGRRDAMLSTLASQRYGSTRFVSGGFLVGEKIEKTAEDVVIGVEAVTVTVSQQSSDSEGKKRKRNVEVTGDDVVTKTKRSRKKLNAAEEEIDEKAEKKSKKEKRRKRHEQETDAAVEEEKAEVSVSLRASSGADEKAERRRQKAERKAQRAAKRLKKEQRRKSKAGAGAEETSSDSDTSTPEVSTAPPPAARGRAFVRSRYITQKRKACMDPTALREIFMVKTPS
ncbi:hypothetical protein EJ08DRAFT_734648 [Tothia fuscella]|uniref:PinX1-related protein 1 n=1 Tax=Tothia fuscella TaxID=1048955 RepID=A0A9P4NPZ0_9PEZI|nr:hypothetical protein EJ08DRAFT_734648 [Tothia fuscella]